MTTLFAIVMKVTAIIWDEVMAAFRATANRDGLEVLKGDVMREVRQAAATLTPGALGSAADGFAGVAWPSPRWPSRQPQSI